MRKLKYVSMVLAGVLMFASLAEAFTNDWDETDPANHTQNKNWPAEIRQTKIQVSDRVSDWISGFVTSETAIGAFYVPLIEKATKPTAAANYGYVYAKDVAGTTELYYEDQAGAETQLTVGGYINGAELAAGSVSTAALNGGVASPDACSFYGMAYDGVTEGFYAVPVITRDADSTFRIHTLTNTPEPGFVIGVGNGSGGQDTTKGYIELVGSTNVMTVKSAVFSATKGITVTSDGMSVSGGITLSSGALTIAEGALTDSTIVGADIKDSTITTDDVYANTLTAADLAAGSVGLSELTSGTATAGNVTVGATDTEDIALDADVAYGTIYAYVFSFGVNSDTSGVGGPISAQIIDVDNGAGVSHSYFLRITNAGAASSDVKYSVSKLGS